VVFLKASMGLLKKAPQMALETREREIHDAMTSGIAKKKLE
jgi:hypothetical protein